ncbi:MAG: aspartate aminotransferase family protein, partial [Chloroflexi bacterium]|nr:aspartate aminotransferase family protein [Chloroflexota bacterium]
MSILETYEALHRGSRALAARASTVFPSGVTHDARAFAPFPIYVERAQGPRKWDVDGNEYVDFIGGHGALLLG